MGAQLPGSPFIILAMRRSGTSYLTSFLQSRGAELGSHLIPPGEANPRGYFEDQQIVAFHQKVLKRLIATPEFDAPAGPLLSNPDLNQEEREEAIAILKRLARPGLWGWKDPRTVHFIDFWLELLPDAKLIVPFRHPLERFYSYLKQIGTIDQVTALSRILDVYAEHHERIQRVVQQRRDRCLVIYAQNAFSESGRLALVLDRFLGLPPDAGATPASFHQPEFSRLLIHRPALDLFRELYPEAASSFDRMNELAEFRFTPIDPPPAEREAFAHLAAAVRQTRGSVAKESWLPVMVDLCRPYGSPTYFGRQSEILKRHVDAERSLNAQQQAAMTEQAAWIAQLQEARDFAQAQAAAYSKELESGKARNSEQSRWIEQLRQAKEFAETQTAAYQKELESCKAVNSEQSRWIEQLRQAKEFAEAQAAAFQKELESRKAVNTEQSRWVEQLRQAKEFAEAQAAAKKKELESCLALNSEQSQWIEQLREAKEFAQAQASAHLKELESCLALNSEQSQWIEQLQQGRGR